MILTRFNELHLSSIACLLIFGKEEQPFLIKVSSLRFFVLAELEISVVVVEVVIGVVASGRKTDGSKIRGYDVAFAKPNMTKNFTISISNKK